MMATDTPLQKKSPRTDLPELLAPAGSKEAFFAAVAAGADAVYLGGKRFGARQYAQNFTDAEMEEAVAYAHARGIAVYITVNTLVHDRELRAAGEYLVWLYAIGVDAVLVQDAGLASLAREIVPGLALHASTQMTIHSADGVRSAAGLGFSRVVPARELTLPEIEAIAQETAGTGTGLEVFAHGALCFSWSGQCLLSSLIGGRSGNRGMCAQPCRKPYALVTGEPDAYGRMAGLSAIPQEGDYLLSPKDLCTYPRLDRLVRSPVVSLKIEGRMKSSEYVAIVVAAYRRALDAIAQGRPFHHDRDLQDCALAFNRGFTGGYLFNNRHVAVMGRERPDNRGLCIGIVERYNAQEQTAVVQPEGGFTPVAGDGLFIGSPGKPGAGTGFALNAAPGMDRGKLVIPVPGQVQKGSRVYVTSSTALAAQARRIIAGEYPELRHPVPIDCTVTVDEAGSVVLEGTIDAGNGRTVRTEYRSDFRLLPAKTRPLTTEQFREQLRKTGGTPFVFRTITLAYSGGMFAPAAQVNRMRREFLSRAEAALVAAGRPTDAAVRAARERLAAALPAGTGVSPPGLGQAPLQENPDLVVYTDTPDGVRAAAAAGCDRICFEPGIPELPQGCRLSAGDAGVQEQVTEAIGICRQAAVPLIWKLPRITRQAAIDRICAILPSLRTKGLTACMAESLGAARALAACCPDIRILGASGLNIFNHRAALAHAPPFTSLTLSPELAGVEITELIRKVRAAGLTVPFELVVQGNAEAMVAETCIIEPILQCRDARTGSPEPERLYGLRDATGRVFPVRIDSSCRTHILNADETCLLDHLPALRQAGVSAVAIDARGRTAAYIQESTGIYREAIRAAASEDPARTSRLAGLKQRIRQISRGGITAGHFLRGLKETQVP
jgi:putative protease